jgi:hypothetical protein
MKAAGISGGKRRKRRDKINYLAMNSKKKNTRDPYREINEFKKGCQPRSQLVKMRLVISLQIPTIF